MKAFRFTMALALITAFLVVGCSDDDTTTNVYEAPPPDTPPLEGGTWLITSPSFVADDIVDFLVTFDTASLDLTRIRYTLEGTTYDYDETVIVGAGSGSGGSVRVVAQWENAGTDVNSFQFNGTVVSNGDEIVGRIQYLIQEPAAGFFGENDDAKMTRQFTQHGELIDIGGGLVYDTVLDITWAQPDNTLRSWDDAKDWVAGLTLGGFSDWRLPYISVAAGAGPLTDDPVLCPATEPECQDNELGYMYWYHLGGTGSPVPPNGDPEVLALFDNLNPNTPYWSGTEHDVSDAWFVSFASGINGVGSGMSITWAVHDGDLRELPPPTAQKE